MHTSSSNQFLLRFRSLFRHGRGFAFPCAPDGTVHLDGLTDRSRMNYLYARAMVGRELDVPTVEPAVLPVTREPSRTQSGSFAVLPSSVQFASSRAM